MCAVNTKCVCLCASLCAHIWCRCVLSVAGSKMTGSSLPDTSLLRREASHSDLQGGIYLVSIFAFVTEKDL